MKELSPLLSPKSIAVIGASPDIKTLRGRILKVMLGHAYRGKIYPVSRSHAEVQGLKAYASVEVLPEKVDLAVLIIPAEFVLDEIERCGRAGVKAVLILTSGFAEQTGEEGRALQKRLSEIAARFSMIVCGPNTEGFANTNAALCATFSPVVDSFADALVPQWRETGHVAVIAQSGGMGFAFFDRGRPKEIPFSYVVTTGNEACLETFDVVEYLLDEGRTDVFLCFLENIKSAATFRRVADKALRAGKPIIVTKIGRSEAGTRAAASHTAALAGTYETYRAMFDHYGIIEGSDIDEMVDLAAAFSMHQRRLPAGKRVGIGTPSGGAGGWMADACANAELEVPELDHETRVRIDAHLPAYGTSQNPVDCTAQAIRDLGYAEMARLIGDSPSVDAVVMIASTRNAELLERDEDRLRTLATDAQKPVLFWSYTQASAAAVGILNRCGFPVLTSMNHCARAIAAMTRYRKHREQHLARPAIDLHADEARVARVRLALIEKVLCEYQVAPLLAEYGLRTLDAALARSAEEAIAAAAAMRGPIALKIQSPNILHKTEVGGVVLNLAKPADIRHHFERLIDIARNRVPADSIRGVLVQRMASKGVEVIVGIRRDALFGPMLMVGIGGTLVEVQRDFVLNPVPVGPADARELIDRLKGRAIFDGLRGGPPSDLPALADLLARISLFAAEHADDIEELELNPVIVHEVGAGVSIADALLVAGRMNETLASI